MLEWALSRREYGVSFAQVAEIRRVKRPEGRFRREIVLHDPDMRVLWEHTDSLTSVNCALRFLLLTGQRTKEVRLARWSDIRDGVWYVSHRKGTTTKNPIPLSSLALAELDRARLFGSELLFPGRDGKALRDGQIRQRAYSIQKIAHMDKWAPHDLRRTLRSKLGDLGVNFAVAEKVLGHELPGEIANVYDVGTAIEPKREALERFADHVRRVLNPPGAPADPVPLALVA
jgi:integrase